MYRKNAWLTKQRLDRLNEQLIKAELNDDLDSIDILFKPIKYLDKYKYIAFTEDDLDQTLYDVIKECLEENDNSYFIKKDNQYIGFVSYWTAKYRPIVNGILFFNFSENNDSNEMFKDTLSLLLKLRIEYEEVNWEADIENKKAIEVYKKYCDRHGGRYTETAYQTVSFNVLGKNQENFSRKIRESFIDENLFEEIYGLKRLI